MKPSLNLGSAARFPPSRRDGDGDGTLFFRKKPHAGYVLDSGVFGLAAFRGGGNFARVETLPTASGRGTAPPSGCQSNYLSQAHTQQPQKRVPASRQPDFIPSG